MSIASATSTGVTRRASLTSTSDGSVSGVSIDIEQQVNALPKLSGTLWKKKSGVKGMFGWNSRWFVVEEMEETAGQGPLNTRLVPPEFALVYYDSDKSKQAKTSIGFRRIVNVGPPPQSSSKENSSPVIFHVTLGAGRVYVLKGANKQQTAEWISGLNTYLNYRKNVQAQEAAERARIASLVGSGAAAGAVSQSPSATASPSPSQGTPDTGSSTNVTLTPATTTTTTTTKTTQHRGNTSQYQSSPAQISMASHNHQSSITAPSSTGPSSNGAVVRGAAANTPAVRRPDPSGSASVSRSTSDVSAHDSYSPRVLASNSNPAPTLRDDDAGKHFARVVVSNKTRLQQLNDDPDLELQLSDEEPEDDDDHDDDDDIPQPTRQVKPQTQRATPAPPAPKAYAGVGKAHPPAHVKNIKPGTKASTEQQLDLDDDWDAPEPVIPRKPTHPKPISTNGTTASTTRATAAAPASASPPAPAPAPATTFPATDSHIDLDSWDDDEPAATAAPAPAPAPRRSPPASIPAPFVAKSVGDNKRQVSGSSASFPDPQRFKSTSIPIRGIHAEAVTSEQGWLEEDFDA